MSLLEILFIAVGLAMDAFAVALGVGASPIVRGPRPAFRISFHFGLFQFLMPMIGWTVGHRVQPLIESFDHWIAFGLLLYVGGRMIHAGIFSNEEPGSRHDDPTTGWSLVVLSVATSIDALAVGLSLAMLRIEILTPSIIIGIVTAGLSLLGLRLGRYFGNRIGKEIEAVGGTILCIIGIRILIGHLFFP